MTSTQPWVWKLVGSQQAPDLVRKPSQWEWHGVGPHRRDQRLQGPGVQLKGPAPCRPAALVQPSQASGLQR